MEASSYTAKSTRNEAQHAPQSVQGFSAADAVMAWSPVVRSPTTLISPSADAAQQQVLHQCLLHVHPVLGFVPHHALWTVDHLGGHFLTAVRG